MNSEIIGAANAGMPANSKAPIMSCLKLFIHPFQSFLTPAIAKKEPIEDDTREGVEPSFPSKPDPKSGAVILNAFSPDKCVACFQLVSINLPTFSELPAQKSVRTG
ncbi:MAG: hypothetical protein QF663_05505 [Verrucomicrobiota bacterium]|nr:hypothetical protein [Verrucomicrobiota bacterium]